MSSIFGGGKQKQTTTNKIDTSLGRMPAQAVVTRTGNSSLNARPGFSADINLDPAIRQLTDEQAGISRAGISRGLENIQALSGNQSPFIQARVNPMVSEFGRRRNELNESLNRRKVFGSFADQSRTNFDVDSGRAIADQTALATNESLNAILQQEAQLRGHTQDLQGAGQSILQEELAALGLSQQAIQMMISSQLPTKSGAGSGSQTTTTSGGGDLLGSVGGILGGLGSIGFNPFR